MNYGDRNFTEITQLRVELVVSSQSSCAVRQCRVESCQEEFGFYLTLL